MTRKQVEMLAELAKITMKSDFLNDDQKIERYKEILHFVEMARDFFWIDEKRREKISHEIWIAAMEAYNEKEVKTA